MKTKKIPLRKCTGCLEMKDKRILCRVVKNKDGEVSLDLTGKKPGRGAYVCKDISCLQRARKARGFERAFSQKIPDEIYDQMERELADHE